METLDIKGSNTSNNNCLNSEAFCRLSKLFEILIKIDQRLKKQGHEKKPNNWGNTDSPNKAQ